MKIESFDVTVGDVIAGYSDSAEEGVFGLNGSLSIRPRYQREFIYKDRQKFAVIETILNGFPLSAMYWARNSDGSLEVLDGQQRTISFCEYVHGGFAVEHRYFHNLSQEEQEKVLSYPLMVYVCEGSDTDKLDWFRTINIASMALTSQELRNAVYAGEWLTSAKRYFSKTDCVAYSLAALYLRGTPIRQDYLETVLDWISEGDIEGYMSQHQHDEDALELWQYFERVINWVQKAFPVYRKEMKGVNWGQLYNAYGRQKLDPADLEAQVTSLMQDEDVTKKAGIYTYVLTGEERHLSIRCFSPAQRREAYERIAGVCPACGQHFELEEMEADHVTPWHEGGRTTADNCQLLCRACNRLKGGR